MAVLGSLPFFGTENPTPDISVSVHICSVDISITFISLKECFLFVSILLSFLLCTLLAGEWLGDRHRC